MDAIVALIQTLIDRGNAYAAKGDVYFRVGSFEGYGKLSNRPREEMAQGEGDDAAELKESPEDFALWKARKEGEDTAWPAPWGEGRPGWHIECSAMAEELLGTDFEIHGGGNDLVFPHHENEIAQTEAARGRPLARLWMHNGMVQMGAEKMAKSVGNISAAAPGARRAWPRRARHVLRVRALPPAARVLGRRPGGGRERRRADPRARPPARPRCSAPEGMDSYAERFFDHLADDFNTAAARSVLSEWVSEANRRLESGARVGPGRLPEMLHALGLEGLLEAPEEEADPRAQRLLEERERPRAARDFGEADRIRDELAALGLRGA